MKTLIYLALVISWTAWATPAPAGETAGLGLVLGAEGHYVVVKNVLPNSPAAQHEIHVGDRITVTQNGESAIAVKNRTLAQIIPMIRGTNGTTVYLTIIPVGEDISGAKVFSFVHGELKELNHWGDGILLAGGVKAPDIQMITLPNGKSERLADYAGKIVVLEFWATWWGSCRPTMQELQGYYAKFPDWKGNVVLITATVDDDQDTVIKYLNAKGWDQSHNVWIAATAIKAYHVGALPTVYIINRRGIIAAVNPFDIPAIVNGELHKAVAAAGK